MTKLKVEILDVYYKDINTPVPLGETKADAPFLDAYRFKREPRFSMEVEIGPEPTGDGMKHALLIGMFIDGVEVPVSTDWLPNSFENRMVVYTLGVPKSPVKLMSTKKVHSVQFKVGGRGYKFGIPQDISPREYNLGESPILYYRIAALGDGDTTGGWDSDGPSGGSTGGGCDDCGSTCGR
jgi:hypothetical protein